MTSTSAKRIDAATPAGRDRYVDLVRLVSIIAVACGHWLLTLLITHGGNGLPGLPGMQLLTWAWQVMPLFFAVGGFSHALALRHHPDLGTFLRARTARLLPPALGFLAVWTVLAVGLSLAGVRSGPVDTALDRVTTPLWFLGVYLLLVLPAPLMYRWHRRHGAWVIAVLAVVAVVFDRTGLSVLNIAVVWLAVHQLGFLYADGPPRWAGPVLAVGGLAATLVLTVLTGAYPVLMVGLPERPVSNMAPPTPALLTHALFLTGVALLLRAPLRRWLARPRVWALTVGGNAVIMTVFCWHLTAAYLVQGLIMVTGLRLPPAGTVTWWLLVPVWWLACAVVLAVLVAALRRLERHTVHSGHSSLPVAVAGLILVALGLYLVSQVGLDGLTGLRAEDVIGVPVTGFAALGVLVAGAILLRLSRRPA